MSAVATIAGPGFDKLNPDYYAVGNIATRLTAVAVWANLSEHHDSPDFDFRVSGGDRYETSEPLTTVYGNGDVEHGLVHRSSTNDSWVKGSAANSRHLTRNGGRAVDLRIRGVSRDGIRTAVQGTAVTELRFYDDDGHTHLGIRK